MRPTADEQRSKIIDVAIGIIEADGYEAVQVRTVARNGRISLSTLYKHFATRDEVIIAAVAQWMQVNAYTQLTVPASDEPWSESFVRIMHAVLEPFERQPNMLRAFDFARHAEGGDQLVIDAMAVMGEIAPPATGRREREYLFDVQLVMLLVVDALIGRAANGHIATTDIVPIMDRALHRLTTAPPEPQPRKGPKGQVKTARRQRRATRQSP